MGVRVNRDGHDGEREKYLQYLPSNFLLFYSGKKKKKFEYKKGGEFKLFPEERKKSRRPGRVSKVFFIELSTVLVHMYM